MKEIHFISKNKAFTLPEILVSILIVALVAITAYTAFYVFSGAGEQTRNRLTALALSQAALEEVKAVARNNFDGLETVIWPAIDQARYPSFHRQITITAPLNAFGLTKRADVTIYWQDKGVAGESSYNATAILSKPSPPLRANIMGKVRSGATAAQLSGVNITLTDYPGTPFRSTDTLGDYTFTDAAGNFQLRTGNWNLRARKSGFVDETQLVQNLSSGEERRVDLNLTPQPADGWIYVRFIREGTTSAISGLTARSCEKNVCSSSGPTYNATNGYGFKITFSDTNTRCFTVRTTDTYKQKYCGHFSDLRSWGKNFNYSGWSSALIGDDGVTVINSDIDRWNGDVSGSLDRICIGPGDDTRNMPQYNGLRNVPLAPVPQANLTGFVHDDGIPQLSESGATIAISWPDVGSGTASWGSVVTDSNGNYTTSLPASNPINIPALQELFPDIRKLIVSVTKTKSFMDCCNQINNSNVTGSYDPSYTIGLIYENDNEVQNFTLPGTQPRSCGNVEGFVKDGSTSPLESLASALVKVSGYPANTDGSGHYLVNCVNAYYKIPAGVHNYEASFGGYYSFNAQSTTSVQYSTRPKVTVVANSLVTNELIKLWPSHTGRIHGVVRESGTNNLLEDVTVTLDSYSNNSVDATDITGSDGIFDFTNSIETWPPVNLPPTDDYYRHTVKNHSLKFTKTGYYDKTDSGILLNSDNLYDAERNISLDQQPHM